MSPTSLSFRSANIPETTTPVSEGLEKDIFITSPFCSPIDVLKDVRAYERERQRVKKAAELAKTKERKERGTVPGRNAWGPWGDKSKTTVARSEISWFGGKGVWDSENENENVEKGQLEAEWPATPVRPMSKEDCLGEVKLADLVTPAKRKNKDGGFEVIPLPRQVIVLDDFTVHDMDVDEPWEHVDGNENENEKVDGPSYAEIISATK